MDYTTVKHDPFAVPVLAAPTPVYRRPTASQSRRRMLARRIRQIEQELAALDQFPDQDPHEDGTILRVVTSETAATHAYTYIATRINGLWYTTGRTGPYKASWAKLVEWLVSRAETVEQVYPRPSSEGVEWIEPVVRRHFEMRTEDAGLAFRLISDLKSAAPSGPEHPGLDWVDSTVDRWFSKWGQDEHPVGLSALSDLVAMLRRAAPWANPEELHGQLGDIPQEGPS
jgi:hypothetical protein